MPFDDMRAQIELRLRGELLRDWCRQLAAADDSVLFDDAWCSGTNVMRFCTSAIDSLVCGWRGSGDLWGLGHLAFYEIENSYDGVWLTLRVSLQGMPAKTKKHVRQVLAVLDGANAMPDDSERSIVAFQWPIDDGSLTANEIVESLDGLWKDRVTPFEKQFALFEVTPPLVEGVELATISNRFERNKKARELCIAAHGAQCVVCGFDSGQTYGKELAGVIDVHHKLPLNQIREDYEVDPVHDLVPVCPNCHRALHSKPGGGVYTIDELREMLNTS